VVAGEVVFVGDAVWDVRASSDLQIPASAGTAAAPVPPSYATPAQSKPGVTHPIYSKSSTAASSAPRIRGCRCRGVAGQVMHQSHGLSFPPSLFDEWWLSTHVPRCVTRLLPGHSGGPVQDLIVLAVLPSDNQSKPELASGLARVESPNGISKPH
jgi:hypothetical protein